MAPFSKAVELVSTVGPILPASAPFITGSETPCAIPRVANNTEHIAVFSFNLSVIIKVWHHERKENAIFICRLGTPGNGLGIIDTTIARSAVILFKAAVSVFIPVEEIHTDHIHTNLVIVFEKSVNPFPCSGMCRQSPDMPYILVARMHHIFITVWIINQGAGCIFRSRYQDILTAMYPHRVVINADTDSSGVGCLYKLLKVQRGLVSHIWRPVLRPECS